MSQNAYIPYLRALRFGDPVQGTAACRYELQAAQSRRRSSAQGRLRLLSATTTKSYRKLNRPTKGVHITLIDFRYRFSSKVTSSRPFTFCAYLSQFSGFTAFPVLKLALLLFKHRHICIGAVPSTLILLSLTTKLIEMFLFIVCITLICIHVYAKKIQKIWKFFLKT